MEVSEERRYRPQVLSYWVTLLDGRVRTSLNQSLGPFDISALQFMIIDMCARQEANTVSSIARIVPFDGSAVSRQAENLRSRGLLRARRLESDRRVVRFDLTKEGHRLRAELLQAAIEADNRISRHLDPEERQRLVDILRKLVVLLEEERR